MKFHSSPTSHTILQNPYLISNLLKWIGSSYSRATASASMMQSITVPTVLRASDGDVSFLASFTKVRSHPANFNTNGRSKIALYFLLLCSIIANSEIFNFDGGFCFMLSHLIMVANLCADFFCAFTCICEIASSSNSGEWGILVTDASILSGV